MIETIKIHDILTIAFEAGQKILDIYHAESFEVDLKSDASPVTIADKTAHQYIYEQLTDKYPDIPIISEEGEILDFKTRQQWPYTWLVDPLDGTKEFIKKNGEFTINIGLIENGSPIAGVIYIPAQETMYFASKATGSYKLSDCTRIIGQSTEQLLASAQKLPLPKQHDAIRVVVSRSHFSPETECYLKQLAQLYPKVETISSGSSIKMCLVAEGAADIYPRLSYSMEWDTAAGEAIVTYSGAHVEVYPSKLPMQYNKEQLKNPFHIVHRA